ncbi:MAG: phospholipase D family protein, partial [Anaerolineae bacterium]|nr:phospholipase D family protein [Anaerolineae bacterium]
MRTPIEFVPPRWDVVFKELLYQVTESALLVSPYISVTPIEQVISVLKQRGLEKLVSIRVVTDLAPDNVLRGSTELSALVMLAKEIPHTIVTYLPGLHAKVYIADAVMGIVTSANLTEGGLYRNYEYGIRLNDPSRVCLLRKDITEYADLGSVVTPAQLNVLSQAAKDLRELHRKKERQASKELRQEFARRVADTELELMKIRATGQSENSIFSATIIYPVSYTHLRA